jgi:hypothetical protein
MFRSRFFMRARFSRLGFFHLQGETRHALLVDEIRTG